MQGHHWAMAGGITMSSLRLSLIFRKQPDAF
jgi:hypothetical protein